MFPKQNEYPEFVADQLLTSEHLNQVFDYLDEQERMTRTNLIGIGVVCGLDVKTNNSGTSVTLTKGCGITSEGYLTAIPESTYTEYRNFDPVKEIYYDKFVDISTKQKIFNLFELVPAAVFEDSIELSKEFLADKVVLIFVELLEEKNKNCDPNSCDDKGKNVTVNFRPLLLSINDAKKLIDSAGGQTPFSLLNRLPEIKMPRFDVPNSNPVTSEHIFGIYKSILSKKFLSSLQNALSKTYLLFSPFMPGEFPSDPFGQLTDDFAFVYNGSISQNQLIHIQYFYDFFSDILQTYEEFRKTGSDILSLCCPLSTLFPRHLLLGEAFPASAGIKSAFRHYFIYSPLFDNEDLFNKLKALFRKLVLLISEFSLPVVNLPTPPTAIDPFIRITPSKLGDITLSEKAIPYYYKLEDAASPLLKSWNYEKTSLGIPDRNLSYHADKYSNFDFIRKPLEFDIEPYNFFRVEGIVGKSYISVLKNIKKQLQQYRLPINIIGLGTDDYSFFSESAASLNEDVLSRIELSKVVCHFQDLESLYETISNEIICILCKELKYYYDLRLNLTAAAQRIVSAVFEPVQSKIPLFEYCSKGYTIQSGTFGAMIEKVNERIGDEEELNIQILKEVLGPENIPGTNIDSGNVSDNIKAASSIMLANIVTLFEIPIYIIRLSNIFAHELKSFNTDDFCALHKKLSDKANNLKTILSTAGEISLKDNIFGIPVDFFKHLDELIYKCNCSALKALQEEFLKRYVYLTKILQFGYYSKMHPGLQHKAGVPAGGTFIIVYHRRKQQAIGVPVRGRYVIRGVVLDADKSPVLGANVQIKGTLKGAVTDVEGKFIIILTSLPVTLTITFPGFNTKEIQIVSDDPIVIVLRNETDSGNIVDRIPEGTVIADFYLPYLCCSECPPMVIEIPPLPLLVSVGNPECDKIGESFKTIITISGGTAPYKIDGNDIQGNNANVILQSGKGQSGTITDSAGNTAPYSIAVHECPKPCSLPCDGEAEQCRYVLWIQRPMDKQKLGNITKAAIINLTDENNVTTKIDVLDIFKGTIDNVSLLISNYDSTIDELLAKLNSKIPTQFLGDSKPMFSYDKETQLLTIEKFVCHKVVMDLQVTISTDYALHVVYDDNGTTVEYSQGEVVKVPKFGCIKMNKCTGETIDPCKEIPQIKTVRCLLENPGETYFNFSATPDFKNYYWYFYEGRPFNSDKKEPEHIFINKRAGETSVRLIGVDSRGCFGIFDGPVKIEVNPG